MNSLNWIPCKDLQKKPKPDFIWKVRQAHEGQCPHHTAKLIFPHLATRTSRSSSYKRSPVPPRCSVPRMTSWLPSHCVKYFLPSTWTMAAQVMRDSFPHDNSISYSW